MVLVTTSLGEVADFGVAATLVVRPSRGRDESSNTGHSGMSWLRRSYFDVPPASRNLRCFSLLIPFGG